MDRKDEFVRVISSLKDEIETITEIVNSIRSHHHWESVNNTFKKEFYKVYNIYKKNIKVMVHFLTKIAYEGCDDYKVEYGVVYGLMEMKHRKLYHNFWDAMDTIEDIYSIYHW